MRRKEMRRRDEATCPQYPTRGQQLVRCRFASTECTCMPIHTSFCSKPLKLMAVISWLCRIQFSSLILLLLFPLPAAAAETFVTREHVFATREALTWGLFASCTAHSRAVCLTGLLVTVVKNYVNIFNTIKNPCREKIANTSKYFSCKQISIQYLCVTPSCS